MHTKPIVRLLLVTLGLLLVPLIAMRFTDEVVWTLSDFVFAFVMIFGAGLAYQVISKRTGNAAYKSAVWLGVAGVFLLVWINGAVGIIGSDDNPANLLYGGVLLVGLIGVIATRLKARGMSRVMYAVAVAQMLVPAAAFLIFRPEVKADEVMGFVGVLVINAVFAGIWAGSGVMFGRAAEVR